MSELVYIMEVERKDDVLFGILATKNLEVYTRDGYISQDEIIAKIGRKAFDLLQPEANEVEKSSIAEHRCAENLEKWGIKDWVVLYRESDLESAGFPTTK